MIMQTQPTNFETTSKTMRRRKTKTFPVRLYDMLEEAENQNFKSIVSWLPSGTAFKIHQPRKFMRRVLPKYFKQQTQYKSFTRQLNLYEFKFIKNEDENNFAVEVENAGGFFHPMFTRGNRDQCHLIPTRRKKKESIQPPTVSAPQALAPKSLWPTPYCAPSSFPVNVISQHVQKAATDYKTPSQIGSPESVLSMASMITPLINHSPCLDGRNDDEKNSFYSSQPPQGDLTPSSYFVNSKLLPLTTTDQPAQGDFPIDAQEQRGAEVAMPVSSYYNDSNNIHHAERNDYYHGSTPQTYLYEEDKRMNEYCAQADLFQAVSETLSQEDNFDSVDPIPLTFCSSSETGTADKPNDDALIADATFLETLLGDDREHEAPSHADDDVIPLEGTSMSPEQREQYLMQYLTVPSRPPATVSPSPSYYCDDQEQQGRSRSPWFGQQEFSLFEYATEASTTMLPAGHGN